MQRTKPGGQGKEGRTQGCPPQGGPQAARKVSKRSLNTPGRRSCEGPKGAPQGLSHSPGGGGGSGENCSNKQNKGCVLQRTHTRTFTAAICKHPTLERTQWQAQSGQIVYTHNRWSSDCLGVLVDRKTMAKGTRLRRVHTTT